MLPTPNTWPVTKAKQKWFCEHVWRHQTKGLITSIQMRIWWGARRAGWRRKCLKQFYFSEPSLEYTNLWCHVRKEENVTNGQVFQDWVRKQWGTVLGLESTIRTKVWEMYSGCEAKHSSGSHNGAWWANSGLWSLILTMPVKPCFDALIKMTPERPRLSSLCTILIQLESQFCRRKEAAFRGTVLKSCKWR